MTSTTDKPALDDLQGDWNYPTTMHFGIGRIAELPDVCKRLHIQRPLLVTDTGLANQQFVADIIESNDAAGIKTSKFSEVKSNPTGSNIEMGIDTYHRGQHDGVIALGGGSALDAGKAIALMVGQKRPLWDFEDIDDNWQRVDPTAIAPTIAVPTTAGTGSEVGRASVIIDESRQKKIIIFHPNMLPDTVIADPVLNLSLPAKLTAATGLDAFVHNLEAYCVPTYHPIADGIALEGMRLIKEWLPVAYQHGDDLTARSHMLAASCMGAMAFQKGLGAIHALAHPLGAHFDIHHGLLNAILLPYVLIRNKPAIEYKLAHVARCLGLKDVSFSGFFHWMMNFRQALQIPEDLRAIGIASDKRDLIGQLALEDPCAAGNPVVFDAGQYAEIFENAVNGHIR